MSKDSEGELSMAKVIAIDGPSGSGKSTLAKSLAQNLGILYIDTGAMFRALAYYFTQHHWPIEKAKANVQETRALLQNLEFAYCPSPGVLIEINGEDLTEKIRQHHISTLASQYSQLPVVRQFLLEKQRELAAEHFCVMEGRDIGSVVFPNAFCKIFLTASVDVRAQRRLKELEEKGMTGLNVDQIIIDIEKRDLADTTRSEAPLLKAHDAVEVDTSTLTLEQVLQKIGCLAKDRSRKVWGEAQGIEQC